MMNPILYPFISNAWTVVLFLAIIFTAMTWLDSILKSCTKLAILDSAGACRYLEVLGNALKASATLQKQCTRGGHGVRVAVLAPPGRHYIEGTLATWLAGGIVVPISLSLPKRQLEYVMQDAGVSIILTTTNLARQAQSIADSRTSVYDLQRLQGDYSKEHIIRKVSESISKLDDNSGSLIIYTSGTTGRSKGVLHTHRSISAQVSALCASWDWQETDKIIHALPLHHIHGIVNALYCPMAVGASVEFLSKFSPTEVWHRIQAPSNFVSVFMGVPTMYHYILSAMNDMDSAAKREAAESARNLRLAVCGSSACPLSVMNQWKSLTGQYLLERYGMTETGMILSNPYSGERRPGFVGLPLPGVQIKLSNTSELAVRSDGLFKEYWNQPNATAASFDSNGYFMTGDTVCTEGNPPYWRILGRTSTDIIKTGGYKVSALQVEDAIMSHKSVDRCAVFGVPHEALGEQIVAVCSLTTNQDDVDSIISHARSRLDKYQVPRKILVVKKIPLNAMGKINKVSLRNQLFSN